MASENWVLGNYQELEEQGKMSDEMIANHLAARNQRQQEVQKRAPPRSTVPYDSDLKQSHRFYICSAKTETIFLSVHIEVEIIESCCQEGGGRNWNEM